jgi:predicted SprT family Zn-dependent metalloprotease
MDRAITTTEYRGFQQAYDFFNAELFSNSLPDVLVTLQRQANAKGYFAPERFNGRVQETAVHELALNPDTFSGRTDEDILSTLAHEMAHVWQQTHGKAPTRCYHDRQWAAKMKEIGLHPSSTGEPGGKETGQSVTHYIIAGGPYAKTYAKLKVTIGGRAVGGGPVIVLEFEKGGLLVLPVRLLLFAAQMQDVAPEIAPAVDVDVSHDRPSRFFSASIKSVMPR